MYIYGPFFWNIGYTAIPSFTFLNIHALIIPSSGAFFLFLFSVWWFSAFKDVRGQLYAKTAVYIVNHAFLRQKMQQTLNTHYIPSTASTITHCYTTIKNRSIPHSRWTHKRNTTLYGYIWFVIGSTSPPRPIYVQVEKKKRIAIGSS